MTRTRALDAPSRESAPRTMAPTSLAGWRARIRRGMTPVRSSSTCATGSRELLWSRSVQPPRASADAAATTRVMTRFMHALLSARDDSALRARGPSNSGCVCLCSYSVTGRLWEERVGELVQIHLDHRVAGALRLVGVARVV